VQVAAGGRRGEARARARVHARVHACICMRFADRRPVLLPRQRLRNSALPPRPPPPARAQVIRCYRCLERLPAVALALLAEHESAALAAHHAGLSADVEARRRALLKLVDVHRSSLHPAMMAPARCGCSAWGFKPGRERGVWGEKGGREGGGRWAGVVGPVRVRSRGEGAVGRPRACNESCCPREGCCGARLHSVPSACASACMVSAGGRSWRRLKWARRIGRWRTRPCWWATADRPWTPRRRRRPACRYAAGACRRGACRLGRCRGAGVLSSWARRTVRGVSMAVGVGPHRCRLGWCGWRRSWRSCWTASCCPRCDTPHARAAYTAPPPHVRVHALLTPGFSRMRVPARPVSTHIAATPTQIAPHASKRSRSHAHPSRPIAAHHYV
jgi:hypothetical protein